MIGKAKSNFVIVNKSPDKFPLSYIGVTHDPRAAKRPIRSLTDGKVISNYSSGNVIIMSVNAVCSVRQSLKNGCETTHEQRE